MHVILSRGKGSVAALLFAVVAYDFSIDSAVFHWKHESMTSNYSDGNYSLMIVVRPELWDPPTRKVETLLLPHHQLHQHQQLVGLDMLISITVFGFDTCSSKREMISVIMTGQIPVTCQYSNPRGFCFQPFEYFPCPHHECAVNLTGVPSFFLPMHFALNVPHPKIQTSLLDSYSAMVLS